MLESCGEPARVESSIVFYVDGLSLVHLTVPTFLSHFVEILWGRGRLASFNWVVGCLGT